MDENESQATLDMDSSIKNELSLPINEGIQDEKIKPVIENIHDSSKNSLEITEMSKNEVNPATESINNLSDALEKPLQIDKINTLEEPLQIDEIRADEVLPDIEPVPVLDKICDDQIAPKTNGDHKVDEVFSPNEDSNLSASSSSSNNLVIDYPMSELDRKKAKKAEEIVKEKPSKRKLSICENGSSGFSPEHKQVHLDYESDIHFALNLTKGCSPLNLSKDSCPDFDEPNAESSKKVEPEAPIVEPSATSELADVIEAQNENHVNECIQEHQSKLSETNPDIQSLESQSDGHQHSPEFGNRLSALLSAPRQESPLQKVEKIESFPAELNFEEENHAHNLQPSLRPNAEVSSPFFHQFISAHSTFPLRESEVVSMEEQIEESTESAFDGGQPKLAQTPPTEDYKCYKCSTSFKTFAELRCHQHVCYFKANSKDTQKDCPVTNNSRNLKKQKFNHRPAASTITTPSCTATSSQLAQSESASDSLAQIDSSEKRKVYKCTVCGNYQENWKLALHMSETHDRHICLVCLQMFPSGEKLSLHLEIVHDIEQSHFDTEEKIVKLSRDPCFLLCCTCEHVFSVYDERFPDHVCMDYMKACKFCGEKGRHTAVCKANPKRRQREKIKSKKKLSNIKINNNNNSQMPVATSVCDNTLNLNAMQGRLLGLTAPISSKSDDAPSIHEPQVEVNNLPKTFPPILEDHPIPVPEITPQSPQVSAQIPPQSTSQALSILNNYHSEESNGSDKMVIDETCNVNNNNYHDNGDDPFMKLDEKLRNLYNDKRHKKNDSIANETETPRTEENSTDGTEAKPTLIVPKFKLRIPKEYQKPIDSDSEVSSSESDAEAEEDNVEEEDKSAEFANDSKDDSKDGVSKVEHEAKSDEVETEAEKAGEDNVEAMELDDTETNDSASELMKFLERKRLEIEQTKLDIERMRSAGKTSVSEEKAENDAEKSPVKLEQETEDKKSVQENPVNEEEQIEASNPQPELQTHLEPIEPETEVEKAEVKPEEVIPPVKEPPSDGIVLADDDAILHDLLLDRPLDKIPMIDFIRTCVKAAVPFCLYCNHARRIAVNGNSLALHLLSSHRYSATVDSITAEELLPTTIVSKLKSFLGDLENYYLNLESYCNIDRLENAVACDERVFECFSCRFSTRIHKELYLHNRKMHLKTAILCFMCRSNFFSYSEILCHICPGAPNKAMIYDIKYRCCLCEVDNIPSAFRLMVHLRKKHFACDICLEDCIDQSRLSSHVWKHKLHHLCYRCGIAYRNKPDITKHLFWKHGTESIICKRCLQKRWRHVYHFCIPPPAFVCDVCNLCFSKAKYLKVHKRLHTDDMRYPCMEDDCNQKFVSRKLLLKHSVVHAPPAPAIEAKQESEEGEESEDKEAVVKADTDKTEVDKEDEKKIEPEISVSIEKSENEEQKDEVKTEDIQKIKEETKENEESTATPKKRKKRSSNRDKESLDDLNLQAPNLSESDSSDESDTESPRMSVQHSLPLNVKVSTLSDDSDDEPGETTEKPALEVGATAEKLSDSENDEADDEDESKYPVPPLHVGLSDHCYCQQFPSQTKRKFETIYTENRELESKEHESKNIEEDGHVEMKDMLKENSRSPRKRKRSQRINDGSASDSSSGSDSSSRSHSSCGSNCSCSSSGSSSDSSSSSDDDSDSSNAESNRKTAEKRDKGAEGSPKARLNSENVDVETSDLKEPETAVNLEPVIMESDLDTAESDTDEDFYDEHPQKLATEMLAEKRRQLMAQTCMSPSRNFDIVENSRPSTPSLPEEAIKEKRNKLKKKKRERKSSCRISPMKHGSFSSPMPPQGDGSQVLPVIHQTAILAPEVDLLPPFDLIASPGAVTPEPSATMPVTPFTHLSAFANNYKPPNEHTPPAAPISFNNRLSTGSSCSDADRKRSKRARRPNKFYGYTSDDDTTSQGQGFFSTNPAFKPTPPPNLTWRKEDLPTPSKSILSNKTPKTPKLKPATMTPKTNSGVKSTGKKERSTSLTRKRPRSDKKLPPIPRLKIRQPTYLTQGKLQSSPLSSALPAQTPPPPVVNPLRLPSVPVHHIQPTPDYPSSKDSSDSDSSDDDSEMHKLHIPVTSYNTAAQQPVAQPQTYVAAAPQLPVPQVPVAKVFNQKVPPALLPNPDFETLQYFKRNNIRYPIRPPAGARPPRDGESVYCYCRCPYDEVSEMIACDGDNCMIEWFHFECVGIMVAPQGKWFCAECRPSYSNELYPTM